MNLVRRARPLLGTLVQISAEATLAEVDLHHLVREAFGEVALVQALMSWHDGTSELSHLNRHALDAPQLLHAHTRAVLTAALEIARLSDGAFDPCVAGVLVRGGVLPSPAHGRLPDAAASWRDIELGPDAVRFQRPLWIDLGGIAKGYAVDLALERLVRAGVTRCVVNAGGDLRVAGAQEHVVAIRHPTHAHAAGYRLALRDEALATSAMFETPGLIDPANRDVYAGHDSVSVRAPSCMTADALTKVALFATPEVAERAFEACAAFCTRLEPSSPG